MLDLADLSHGLTVSSYGRSHPEAAVDLSLFPSYNVILLMPFFNLFITHMILIVLYDF